MTFEIWARTLVVEKIPKKKGGMEEQTRLVYRLYKGGYADAETAGAEAQRLSAKWNNEFVVKEGVPNGESGSAGRGIPQPERIRPQRRQTGPVQATLFDGSDEGAGGDLRDRYGVL